MASLNNCQFIGNLGNDPDVRYLADGTATASISIATTEKWKDKNTGEQKERTEWIRCEFFGRLAEIVGQYLKKGSSVYVQGRFSTRKYTDKDGVEKYATAIKCDQLQMLGGKAEGGGQGAAPQQQRQAAPAQQGQRRPEPQNYGGMDDDIPF